MTSAAPILGCVVAISVAMMRSRHGPQLSGAMSAYYAGDGDRRN